MKEKFIKFDYEKEYEDMEELLVPRVKEILDFKIMIYQNELLSMLYNCESPIEQIMSMELYDVLLQFRQNRNIEEIGFQSQAKIKANNKNYRVDFLLEFAFKIDNEAKELFKLIIECDGHEFHEKTKEQAKNDKERDRNLISEGYDIIHFTGSEIFNKHYICGTEIKNFINKKYMIFLEKEREKENGK